MEPNTNLEKEINEELERVFNILRMLNKKTHKLKSYNNDRANSISTTLRTCIENVCLDLKIQNFSDRIITDGILKITTL